MTNAVDLLDKHWAKAVGKPMDEVTKHHLYYSIEAIQEAQKEAYNEAIRDAAKNASTKSIGYLQGKSVLSIDRQSILTLLKP